MWTSKGSYERLPFLDIKKEKEYTEKYKQEF